MQRRAGFTLIEIAIAVFILMLLLLLAIPSVTGVLANRRLQSSLDAMNRIVRGVVTWVCSWPRRDPIWCAA